MNMFDVRSFNALIMNTFLKNEKYIHMFNNEELSSFLENMTNIEQLILSLYIQAKLNIPGDAIISVSIGSYEIILSDILQ